MVEINPAELEVTSAGPSLPPTTGRRLVGNVASLSVAAAITKVVSFVSQLVVARLLGPAALGALAVALSLVSLCNVFTDGGLTNYSLREIVRHPSRRARLISATLILQVALSLTGMAAMGLIAATAHWNGQTGLLIAAISPALLFSALSLGYVLQSVEMMGALALARVVGALATALASVLLVALTRQAIWVVIATSAGVLGSDMVIYRSLRRRIPLSFVRVPIRTLRQVSRHGVPFLISGILFTIPVVYDTVTINVLLGARAAGLYNAAWQLSFTALTVAMLVVDAAYPELVRRWQRGAPELKKLLELMVALIARFSLPVTIGIFFCANSVVQVIFGRGFSDSAGILRVLIWLVPLSFLTVVLLQALMAANGQRYALRVNTIVVTANLALCPIAAKQFGSVGVAWAVVVTYGLQLSFYGLLTRSRHICNLHWVLLREVPYAGFPVLFCLAGSRAEFGRTPPAIALLTALGVVLAEITMQRPTLRLATAIYHRPAPPEAGRHRHR